MVRSWPTQHWPTQHWPRRRWVAAVLALPLLTAAFHSAAGVAPEAAPAGWLALLLVAAAAGSAILASYVPARGLRPDVGCSPCAAVAGLSVIGAALVLGTYGAHPSGPLLAVAMTGFGLAQRLRRQPACATAQG